MREIELNQLGSCRGQAAEGKQKKAYLSNRRRRYERKGSQRLRRGYFVERLGSEVLMITN